MSGLYNFITGTGDPPIPTYEEVTRGSSPGETLYVAPTVDSPRRSEDSLYSARRRHVSHDDDDLTSLESDDGDSDSEGFQRDIDRMDYEGDDMEMQELGRNGRNATRRSRRTHLDSHGWKGRLQDWKRRVSSLGQSWSFNSPSWLCASCPSIPDNLKWIGIGIAARLLGLGVLIAIGYAIFSLAILPTVSHEMATMFDPENVRQFAQSSVDVEKIKENLRHISSFDHVAGTKGSFFLAEWMREKFLDAGMDKVQMDEYYVYLNYPTKDGRKVAIVDPPEMKWEAKLEEEPFYPPNVGPSKENTLAWHGHSKSGTVTGPIIYANYGSYDDYKKVCGMVNCNNTIALVRYYGTQTDRALKIKAAEDWGIQGVLIYSDPAEDGFIKGPVWPAGPWGTTDHLQRGAVSLMSWIVGDVLTPGWASTKGAKRIPVENNPGLVKIPSLPLSWRDAQQLLKAMRGHGHVVSDDWRGAVPDVEWWTGDENSPKVLLQNEQDEVEKQRIFNVMGRFEGTEMSDKTVIIGNHRDSWCFGAADPGSGTAVMLEVVRILGKLYAQTWRPARSIVIGSWDAEEYNMIGSTEFVEDSIDELRKNAVAYLNVDVGVSGGDFRASASPQFHRPLLRVLGRVGDPSKNKTLRSIWNERGQSLGGLGSGSDYVAFQDLAGTSSIDFGFTGQTYPYHSCYETFEWMERFGDPGFEYHKLLAEVWVLLVLEFAQESLLPFGMEEYASAVKGYVDKLASDCQTLYPQARQASPDTQLDLSPLYDAVKVFEESALKTTQWGDIWYSKVMGMPPADPDYLGSTNGLFEDQNLGHQRHIHNNKVSDFETNLLDLPRQGNELKDREAEGELGKEYGIPGREQFKHVVFGPQRFSGYDEAYFPFVRDALERGNMTEAQLMVARTARILKNAAEKLGEE
jgi:N-acetylated-alpha-linked acidic dipeptidase